MPDPCEKFLRFSIVVPMVETASYRKNKIELSEYDYLTDVQNRVLMAQFSVQDLEILEEILYSALRIPLTVLEKNLNIPKAKLLPILEKLSQTKLFTIKEDHALVDKEMRKYYEHQILKFDADFKPGMEYFQGLLRKVPIHVLPSWYAISRTSNNIFESIVEKYLFTPQIYQRYLLELNLTDPIQKEIMDLLFNAPGFELEASTIIEKLDLTQEEFEEQMLQLEYRMICCVTYRREGAHFKEIVSPFEEWQDYLCHMSHLSLTPISNPKTITREKSSDFAFVEELSALLELAQKGAGLKDKKIFSALQKKCPDFNEEDFDYLVQKLYLLNLVEKKGEEIFTTADGAKWLKLNLTDRAIYLYRHPRNSITMKNVPKELCTERTIREAEKSIHRVGHLGWIFLDDFLKCVSIPLNESQTITLRKIGKSWKYQLPEYSEREIAFFTALVEQWLYEAGILSIGVKNSRSCFCITAFGRDLFGIEDAGSSL